MHSLLLFAYICITQYSSHLFLLCVIIYIYPNPLDHYVIVKYSIALLEVTSALHFTHLKNCGLDGSTFSIVFKIQCTKILFQIQISFKISKVKQFRQVPLWVTSVGVKLCSRHIPQSNLSLSCLLLKRGKQCINQIQRQELVRRENVEDWEQSVIL
jgi:hypothetical protein